MEGCAKNICHLADFFFLSFVSHVNVFDRQRMRKIKLIYQAGESYRAFSKDLGLQKPKVRAVIRKWRDMGKIVNLTKSAKNLVINVKQE